MPRVRTALLGLIVVFSSLIWGRAEDTRTSLERAQDFEKAGKNRESIPIYLEVLHSDPRCAEAEVGLGRNYYAVGEYAQAAASFEKGLQLRPGNLEIINWLGKSYLREKQPEKVLELVWHQGPKNDDSASIHLLLARAYDAQDKLDEAIHEIQQALNLDPRCHGAHFAWGFIAWSTGDMATAEHELRREVDIDPHESLAAYYLGEVLEKQGKLAEAEAVIAQMSRSAPDTYLYPLGLGKVYEREKKYPLAAEQYQEAIRLNPKQLEAHYRLAVVLRARGETARANEEFQAFSQLQAQSEGGANQGMGRMRPRIPDFD